MQPRPVYELLDTAAQRFGGQPALFQPAPGKGDAKYQITTWNGYAQAVREIAAGLRSLGVNKGDIVALDSDTRAEFYLADFGVMTAGAIAAAMYTSYTFAQRAATLQSLGVKVVLVENSKVYEALCKALDGRLSCHWVTLTGETPEAMSLAALRAKGREAMQADPDLWPRLRREINPDDPAMLYLTSGATGEPKMGLVTHGAITSNVDSAEQVLKLNPADRTLVFLPSAHITQRLALQVLPVAYGMPVYFSESLNKLPNELKKVKPTFFVAPPRFWERIYTRITTEVRKKPAYARQLFYGALGAGAKAARLRQQGKPLPGWLVSTLKLADKLVYRKLRDQFGGEVRIAVSGSAPLSRDLALFYDAIGLPITEGYGLTEGGITCLNPIGRPKHGSIGQALPGVDVKVSEDGELLLRGECLFSGYYRDPAATQAVLREGWLHTGDIAEIDRDGFIYITGRKKEVIVASNGKKVYPARIEGLFKTEPLINQVILVGDRLPYVSALFTINAPVAEQLKGMADWRGRASSEVVTAPPVQAEVQRIVERANKQLADFERIRRFRILEREFTVDTGELTPTMKVRRSRVLENYRPLVNEMYAGKEEFA